ncbi:hypothetical protein G6F57_004251 [Rhizopus arrhizus]|uniref:GATA-type domain-containing protein n=1 Tax=Rhizopus oryzae TaxID=64495 RepID=A0A9P7BNR3_RHIOR|nr:hypothetical protein G6F23_006427 [Rhizopus arrhizus]KAG1409322.1 hypothetical protein G6F58_009369 [Rhizopus delemar]KAG0786573.1 hypothetical protein G6F21_008502 [Rhizopus arrhizus]KAG0789665.1 hypothetical protein G6F22_006637 [Rhizopus arrhizus]KAG0807008.1 hypothetical protein G6F20_010682 [Rhizopus arrhizus]
MSSSALIAAKKRVENSLRKFEIPTQEDAEEVKDDKSGTLYLSLLQSRLNWATSVFIKYKPDSHQQPRRAITTRKKWPNMKYLGSCRLHVGPHLFEDTAFYEASRSERWSEIVAAHQQGDKKKTVKRVEKRGAGKAKGPPTTQGSGHSSPVSSTEEATDLDGSLASSSEEKPTTVAQPDAAEQNDGQGSERLEWTDIVFELKEVPSERYVFPKESLISIETESSQLRASFALPLNPDMADGFFDTPTNKILKHGSSCHMEYVQRILVTEKQDSKLTYDRYEPVNLLLSNVNAEITEGLKAVLHDPKEVKKRLSLKATLFPQKRYIQYSSNSKMNEIETLLNRILTVPDIITGPIMAEKKRNEILNAIKLGKRERDEKFEAELPKTKLPGVRDESMLRCAYCSTKYTTMWRSGPEGHGTLCNSCGLQWKRGEILEGAKMISLRRERRMQRERRERERQAEALEMEKTERESKKQKRQERSGPDTSFLDVVRGMDGMSHFAAQLIQQRQNKTKAVAASSELAQSLPACTLASNPPPPLSTSPTPLSSMPAAASPASTLSQSAQSYSLYSAGGIPLPTLSIDFGGALVFSHPNCGITLLDSFFSIRLCKDGHEQTMVQFDKKELADATFKVLNEGDLQNPREVLKMTIATEPKTITAYENTALIDRQHPITVRFLEKLDPSGGAVVQRILQRWLITFPQQPS